MKQVLFVAALLTVGAALIFPAGKDPVTISWKPKLGEVHKYKYKLIVPFRGIIITRTSDLTETIKAIRPDQSVTVENKTTNGQTTYAGQPMPSFQDSTEDVVTAPDGRTIRRETDSENSHPNNEEFNQFLFPSKPLNVGDTWQLKGPGDPDGGSIPYEINYTYKGTETADGVSCNKIEFTFKELNCLNPITGSGTVWLDPRDGSVVRKRLKGKDFTSSAEGIDEEISQDLKS
jgi:hypothetical protein